MALQTQLLLSLLMLVSAAAIATCEPTYYRAWSGYWREDIPDVVNSDNWPGHITQFIGKTVDFGSWASPSAMMSYTVAIPSRAAIARGAPAEVALIQ
jgi:hypothetical protein